MADRRADDTPLAPRRTLSGASRTDGDDDTRIQAPVTVASSGSGPSGATSARSSSGTAEPRSGGGQAAPGPAPTQSRPSAAQTRPRGTRRARLRLVHLDPWSVMKTAFLLSIALGIVLVVAVAVVWGVLGAAGVWDSINKTVTEVIGGDSAKNFDVKNYVGTSRVLGFTMIVAVVDVILITAISTLGAFLYNLAAALLGGVEVTLAEDER
jgi:Transmembrane domain of unknown function (DUF3566)